MDPHPNAATETLDVRGVEAGDRPVPRRIATDRLVFRRVHPGAVDVDRLHALFADADPDLFALTGWDPHADPAETRTYLDRRVEDWESGGRYEFVLASDGEYVGTACLEVAEGDGAGDYGLWLRRDHWGRGFSGEVTDALTHVAFESLAAPYVVVGCLPSNDRSRRAIETFVRRYDGAYVGSPPTVPSRAEGQESPEVVGHHEWVVTREGFDGGDRGLSTLIPGVEYDDLAF